LVPTAARGAGARITWRQVWQYAIKATLSQLRKQKRKEGGGQLTKIQQQERRWVAKICLSHFHVHYCKLCLQQ
jgi:hypothetical protein